MEKKDVKEELIKRYKYFYENYPLILAFYHEKKEYIKRHKEKFKEILKYVPKEYYNSFDVSKEDLKKLEVSLLSDIRLEDTDFYKDFELRKQDTDFLKRAKTIIEEDRKEYSPDITFRQLMSQVRYYIVDQSGDLTNKEAKLIVLDEYFRIDNYTNDGKVWRSGFEFDFRDFQNVQYATARFGAKDPKPTRDKKDVGVKKNVFISTIYDWYRNEKIALYLSEEEKQQIYLTFHDELPWDLLINCSNNEYDEDKLVRPSNTEPCGKEFYIKEQEMFEIDQSYYQRCPECGFIVHIPSEILTDGPRKRIADRMEANPYESRENILNSELQGINNKKTKELKKQRS